MAYDDLWITPRELMQGSTYFHCADQDTNHEKAAPRVADPFAHENRSRGGESSGQVEKHDSLESFTLIDTQEK